MTRVWSLFEFPSFGSGALAVWLRNFLYFRYTWILSLVWILFEPVLYLSAIGFGLGTFVSQLQGQPYSVFFFTGLLATNGAIVSFFEASYASFTKLTRQRTFETILLSPVTADEVSIGEIGWASSKGFFSALGILVVGAVLGLVESPMIGFALVAIWLNCWIFAAFGFLVASVAKNYDSFTYSQSGVIIPMSLISGLYFPVNSMPWGLQAISYVLPLSHAIDATRWLSQGLIVSGVFLNTLVLFIYAFFLTNVSCTAMRKKLLI